MHIWIDADACPVVIKEILFKAANRTQTPCTLIANQYISTPPSAYITAIQVSQGFDVADKEIVKRASENDLVITSDIPLANEIIEKGAFALSPRGEMYSRENIKARLNMRDFMETLRASGEQTGGPPPLNQQDRQEFANQLDRYLRKHTRPE
jgi:uncharacterized protein YaiI (UPF0178 family)